MASSRKSPSALAWIFVVVMLFCAIDLVARSEAEGAVKNPHASMTMTIPTVVPEATPAPTPVPMSSAAQANQYETGRIVEVVSASELEPETTWTPPHSPMHGVNLSAVPLEFSVISSETIARVKLIKAEGIIYEEQGSDNIRYFMPLIRYEFEVLEYLKGGKGKDRIWAIVHLSSGFSSEQDAPEERSRAVLSYYLNLRETRWDNHEVIVFLEDSILHLPSTHPDDHYYLGMFYEDAEAYALSARRYWLPLAASNGVSGVDGASDAGSERGFLLKHPNGHIWGEDGYPEIYAASSALGASGASNNTTIGLSELRELAAMSEGELVFRWALKYGWAAIPALTTAATHNSVSLGWELHVPKKSEPDYIPFQSGFQILRKAPGDGEFKRIAELDADANSYTDTADLKPASSYIYILRMLTVFEHDVDVQVEATTAAAPILTATPTPAP